jgi:hypothetical protein
LRAFYACHVGNNATMNAMFGNAHWARFSRPVRLPWFHCRHCRASAPGSYINAGNDFISVFHIAYDAF